MSVGIGHEYYSSFIFSLLSSFRRFLQLPTVRLLLEESGRSLQPSAESQVTHQLLLRRSEDVALHPHCSRSGSSCDFASGSCVSQEDCDSNCTYQRRQQVSNEVFSLKPLSNISHFRCVSSNLITVMFPIFPWIFQAGVIILSLLMFLYLASIGEPQYKVSGMKTPQSCLCTGNYSQIKDGESCTPTLFNQLCGGNLIGAPCVASCLYIGLHAPQLALYFKIINVVGFFWLIFFISAFAEMVLAGTFARWYWTLRKEDVPFFTLTGSIYRTFRFHLGTLAFGSLIITICRIIRLVLEYIDNKLKKYDNELTKAIMCCCRCFFWCLENFLKFMNRNAYIMCAIHGKNFLSSAKDSFNLLMRNVLRVIALDQTTDFLFFLSKLLISMGMAACTFTYLSSELFNQHFPNILLHYPLAQVCFIFVGTYFIASVFFGVYSMAVDTLFLCFCKLFRIYLKSKQLRINFQWKTASEMMDLPIVRTSCQSSS